jgi:hypothetical protein
MYPLKFDAKLSGDGSSVSFIEIPRKIMSAFGGRTRVKVKASLNGYGYRTTIFKMKGCIGIPVRREIRENAGVERGERVQVLLEEDLEVRAVTVPPDMLKALKSEEDLFSRFKELSYSHQKEYVVWVTAAKKPETRVARISKTIQKLRSAS